MAWSERFNLTILSSEQKAAFLEMFPEVEPEPLYRASRDGFEAATFHTRCNNRGPTVTVVKSAQGHVFGGYSDVSWDSSGQFRHSQTAFLFKLAQQDQVNVSRHNLVRSRSHHQYAIYCAGERGPTFGGGRGGLDFEVILNGTASSHMNLGSTFNRGPGGLQ